MSLSRIIGGRSCATKISHRSRQLIIDNQLSLCVLVVIPWSSHGFRVTFEWHCITIWPNENIALQRYLIVSTTISLNIPVHLIGYDVAFVEQCIHPCRCIVSKTYHDHSRDHVDRHMVWYFTDHPNSNSLLLAAFADELYLKLYFLSWAGPLAF